MLPGWIASPMLGQQNLSGGPLFLSWPCGNLPGAPSLSLLPCLLLSTHSWFYRSSLLLLPVFRTQSWNAIIISCRGEHKETNNIIFCMCEREIVSGWKTDVCVSFVHTFPNEFLIADEMRRDLGQDFKTIFVETLVLHYSFTRCGNLYY